MARIFIGAPTETEIEDKRRRYEDSINALKGEDKTAADMPHRTERHEPLEPYGVEGQPAAPDGLRCVISGWRIAVRQG